MHERRVWEIIEKAAICMMVTRFDGGLRARPLEARADRGQNLIWFLTDRRGLKDNEVKAHPEVCLTFVYPKEKVYLSVTGRAFASKDSCRAKELWNQEQQAWWPGGPDDPNVLVMKVELDRAEMWDGPTNSAIAAFEFAKARLTGTKPHLGEKRKVTVQME
jgi:general stress protein 26